MRRNVRVARAMPVGGSAPLRRPKNLIPCLVGVCLLYAALAGLYSLRTPAWENNDEESHVQYVTYLRVHRTFPPLEPGNGIEVHQGPLYYGLVAAWAGLIGVPAFTPDVSPAPNATVLSALQVSHDYTATQRDQARWLHWLRVPSVLFGLIVVAAAFATGVILTGSLKAATATGATVAVWPRFLVITSAVNNDALAYAACAVGLVCVLQSRRRQVGASDASKHRTVWFVGAGASFAVAVLTKQTTLPVIGVLLLAVVAIGIRDKAWRGPVVAITVCVAGSAWWYVRNLVEHGDLLAARSTNSYLAEMLPPLIRPHATLAPIPNELAGRLVTSVWYGAGWNQTELPRAGGLSLSLLAVAAIVGVIWRGRDVLRHRGLLLACLGAGFISWALLVAQTTQNEGRYLFVALTSVATLLVMGTVAVIRPRSPIVESAVYAVWPVLLGAVNVYAIVTWLLPYGGL